MSLEAALNILRRISFFIVLIILGLLYQKINVYPALDIVSVSTFIDKQIPFVPQFVIPYVSWYLYISLGSFLLSARKNQDYYKYLAGLVSGWLVCCGCFYFWPVEIIRPGIETKDAFSRAVQFIYIIDGRFNCLPSTHVLAATLVTLFLCKYYRNSCIRIMSVIWCLLICISTLFIKQHYMLDVVSAIILSLILFSLFNLPIMKTVPGKSFDPRKETTANLVD